VGALVVAGATMTAAEASDYSHVCRTADGRLEMSDEVLTAVDDKTQTAIPYEKLGETVLAERRGYCQARGGKYEFAAKTYALKVRIRDHGQPIEVDLLCELAADGLPAAYTCEREVTTYEKTRAATTGGSPPLWNHNGSVMRLEADGANRRFVYEKPRPGIAEAGAKPGDVVFEGRREGSVYRGTAYIFSARCGRLPYAVVGDVRGDERRVVLTGQAPRIGRDCRIDGSVADKLVFDLIGR
jgi:hypothetical protein